MCVKGRADLRVTRYSVSMQISVDLVTASAAMIALLNLAPTYSATASVHEIRHMQ